MGKGHFNRTFLCLLCDERVPLRRHLARTTNVGMGQRVLRTTSKQDRLAKLEYYCVCCGEAAKREGKTKGGEGGGGGEEETTGALSTVPTRGSTGTLCVERAKQLTAGLRQGCLLGRRQAPATRPPSGRCLGRSGEQVKASISRYGCPDRPGW